jgi:hypothetical protein
MAQIIMLCAANLHVVVISTELDSGCIQTLGKNHIGLCFINNF